MPRNTKTERHTLALLDEHHVLREALGYWLVNNGPYAVNWSGTRVEELMAAMDKGLRPDMVVLALRPPDEAGFKALERIKDERPALRCTAYTHRKDEATTIRAFRSGVQALVYDGMEPNTVLHALATAMEGAVVHTPDTQRLLLENPDGLTPEERRQQRLLAQLSARELEVLKALVAFPHLTNEALGRKLKIGRRTVESHIRTLCERFGVTGRVALVVAAIRVGIVQL
ncbi:MAG: response regulator transcription factor [Flavobacteriales bacterium]|nr:response regulator transcription factor [Flavobacteriales bacterium]